MTNSRRTFFQSLVKAAAIVALAPQLAFRVRPEVVTLTHDQIMQKEFVQAFFFPKERIIAPLFQEEYRKLETIVTYGPPQPYRLLQEMRAAEELKKLYGV